MKKLLARLAATLPDRYDALLMLGSSTATGLAAVYVLVALPTFALTGHVITLGEFAAG